YPREEKRCWLSAKRRVCMAMAAGCEVSPLSQLTTQIAVGKFTWPSNSCVGGGTLPTVKVGVREAISRSYREPHWSADEVAICAGSVLCTLRKERPEL